MTKRRVFRRMVFAGILVFFEVFSAKYVSALTYQSSVDVRFTFDPTISLSVGGNLLINNLTPGNSSDSNIIDVAVSTNASYGYVLSATVGQKNGTDSLVNTSNNTYSFTNLSTTAGSAATLSNFADNKWGYSYSVDSGTNWISGSAGSTASGYAGLPLDNNDNAEDRGLGGVTLIDTDNPADNQTIKFKIGAKAANDQAAGTYSNTINFYAVAHEIPVTISDLINMQDFASLSAPNKTNVLNSMVQDTQYAIKDSRDQQNYTIAKLSDGNVWMTKNLSLDISEYGDQITGDNTNNPTSSFLNTVSSNPASSSWCYNQSSSCTDIIAYNTNNIGRTEVGSDGHTYDDYGIYYNYFTATSGNGTIANGGIVEGDLCPSGWHIPNKNEYAALGSTVNSGSTNTDAGLLAQPINLTRSGYISSGGYDDRGEKGRYWTANSEDRDWAYTLNFRNTYVSYGGDGLYKHSYATIRCKLSD